MRSVRIKLCCKLFSRITYFSLLMNTCRLLPAAGYRNNSSYIAVADTPSLILTRVCTSENIKRKQIAFTANARMPSSMNNNPQNTRGRRVIRPRDLKNCLRQKLHGGDLKKNYFKNRPRQFFWYITQILAPGNLISILNFKIVKSCLFREKERRKIS